MSRPVTPIGLTARSARLWRQTCDDYEFTAAELVLLEEALRSLDRADEARRLVDKHGMVVPTEAGGTKMHPAAVIERDCRAAVATMFKQLKLHEAPKQAVW
jgi:Phage terminase, small subunit